LKVLLSVAALGDGLFGGSGRMEGAPLLKGLCDININDPFHKQKEFML
jgi:hypothetical protein